MRNSVIDYVKREKLSKPSLDPRHGSVFIITDFMVIELPIVNIIGLPTEQNLQAISSQLGDHSSFAS